MLYATKPKMNGASGTPSVIISVQMPMNLARSFLKNVSTTTALPIAEAGQMKKAAKARHVAMEPYEFVFAQAMLNSAAPIKEIMKIGRRPYRVDKGRQNKGPPPIMAI